MSEQIEYRKADGDEWRTFCEGGRPREFADGAAEAFAFTSSDERLVNQFRIRGAKSGAGIEDEVKRKTATAAASRANLAAARAVLAAARKVKVQS